MTQDDDRLIGKVAWRIVPLLFLGAVLANLDKSNIGIASLQMNDDIGLRPGTYGLGIGLFFVVYALFEVPSNLGLARFGARLWLARIMLTWGLVSAGGALIAGPGTYMLNRVLLGVAEAGYLPGCIACLSMWLPARYRARALSSFMISVPLAVVIGGPLSAALLSLDGLWGVRGWRWLFLIEGAPSMALALVMWRTLRDSPEQAAWLTAADRARLADLLGADRPAGHGRADRREVVRAVTRPVVILFTLVLGCLGGVNLALTFWLPQLLKGGGLTRLETGFASALPYASGVIGMLLWSRYADRASQKGVYLAAPAILAGATLAFLPLAPGPVAQFTLITVAITSVLSMQGVFWAAVSEILSGSQRIVGVAVINAGGTLLAFLAPTLIGVSKQLTGRFDAAFLLLGLLGIAGGLLSLALLRQMTRRAGAPTG